MTNNPGIIEMWLPNLTELKHQQDADANMHFFSDQVRILYNQVQ